MGGQQNTFGGKLQPHVSVSDNRGVYLERRDVPARVHLGDVELTLQLLHFAPHRLVHLEQQSASPSPREEHGCRCYTCDALGSSSERSET